MVANIIVNRPACDWVTYTTSSGEAYRAAVRGVMGKVEQSPEPTRRMQYIGDSAGPVFYGEGNQEGERHYMINISGGESDNHILHLADSEPGRWTRVDLQLTIERPSWYKARSLYDTMVSSVWEGRARSSTLIQNHDGSDTVYIGSKRSDRLIRVYVKEKQYLRFEVQYRRRYAESAMSHIKIGRRDAIRGILMSEIGKLPQHPVWAEFQALLRGAAVDVTAYRVNATGLSRIKWLASLLPTIRQMANDHDYGHSVVAWLKEIVDEQEGTG